MQIFVSGITMGSIYALMALSIGIVYSTTGIINFAHGAIVMIGAVIAFWLMIMVGIPIWASIPITVALTALIHVVIYRICIKYLGNLNLNLGWILTLLGASIILNNLVRVLFGSEPQPFPYLFGQMKITIFGFSILFHEIIMIVITLIIGISYQAMLQKTTLGIAIRAVSTRPDTAKLMGIKSDSIVLLCFAIAGGVAAIGGILIAPITFVSYTMTMSIGLKGFAAALIGGLGNTKGAFIGGLSLGIIESLLSQYLPLGLKDAISYAIMIIIILVMPGGILNARAFSKKVNTNKL